MAINPAVIARIKETANIVEVVGDYVSLKRKGASYWGNCPFHHEKTPSFCVTASKGIYKCFGCQKGGDSVKFLMEYNGISYHDALIQLANKYHIEVEETQESEEEKKNALERESLLRVSNFACKYFEKNLHETDEGKEIGLSYLHSRGFTDEAITTYRLGYALDAWDDLLKNVSKDDLPLFQKVSLIKSNDNNSKLFDFFRGRVIFPFISEGGQVIAFTARLLTKQTEKVNVKYLNSPESPIFKKGNEVYGLAQAKKAIMNADSVYMVEGQADVISLHQNGIKNVVCCSGGTGLTETQSHKLGKLTHNIVLMYDSDAAGEKDTDQAINTALQWGFSVSIVRLPDGQDPDEFAQTHEASEIEEYVQKHKIDFYEYKCQQVQKEADPIKRVKLIREKLVTTLALISDRIVLNEYIKLCAERIGWKEEDLVREIDKEKLRIAEEEEKQKRFAELEARNGMEAPQNGDAAEYGMQDIPPAPDDVEGAQHSTEQTQPQKVKISDPRLSKFDTLEFLILQFAIRKGQEPVFADDNGAPITVNKFIVENLVESDSIEFKNPVNQAFLYELAAHYNDADFEPTKFFMTHPDLRISNLAIELLSDKYILSKLFTEDTNKPRVEGATQQEIASAQERLNKYKEKKRAQMLQSLGDELNKTILEYKALIISEQIDQVSLALKHASEQHNSDEVLKLIEQMAQLNAQKMALSNALGGRIIIKMG